jgi:hypothetical protein
MTLKFFIGKICKKHPELQGRRYVNRKICPACSKEQAKAFATANPEKINVKRPAWNAANREKVNAYSRTKSKEQVKNTRLKNGYGITLADYNKMFEIQGGCCMICKRHQSVLKRPLAVDHCHVTNKIRGLLCANCNPMLGFAKDSVETLQAAIKYLGDSNGRSIKPK